MECTTRPILDTHYLTLSNPAMAWVKTGAGGGLGQRATRREHIWPPFFVMGGRGAGNLCKPAHPPGLPFEGWEPPPPPPQNAPCRGVGRRKHHFSAFQGQANPLAMSSLREVKETLCVYPVAAENIQTIECGYSRA